jgi:hypothetical protein
MPGTSLRAGPSHLHPMESTIDIAHLRLFEGGRVRVRIRDAADLVGILRTDLLTDRSLAVYIDCGNGDGATIYIDHIVGIWPEH